MRVFNLSMTDQQMDGQSLLYSTHFRNKKLKKKRAQYCLIVFEKKTNKTSQMKKHVEKLGLLLVLLLPISAYLLFFLVACARLYTLLCQSVGGWVHYKFRKNLVVL